MKRQKLIQLFSCEVWKVTDTLSLFFAFLTGSFVVLLLCLSSSFCLSCR